MERSDLIFTDDARVAVIIMSAGEESPWHHHTHVAENIVCLSGNIVLQYGLQKTRVSLSPGQIHPIPPRVIHKLINSEEEPSSYLLIQKGNYDFVPGD